MPSLTGGISSRPSRNSLMYRPVPPHITTVSRPENISSHQDKASDSKMDAFTSSWIECELMKKCLTAESCTGLGFATPIFSSRKHCRLSAEMIEVSKCLANSMAREVFPDAVGPVIIMTVLGNIIRVTYPLPDRFLLLNPDRLFPLPLRYIPRRSCSNHTFLPPQPVCRPPIRGYHIAKVRYFLFSKQPDIPVYCFLL